MTCRNMRLSAVATAWCQANLSRFRIRPRRYFLLCPAAGEADCHVASLLAMTRGEALAPADTCPSSACHCEPVRTLVWQSASPQRYLTSWQPLGQIRSTFPYSPKVLLSVMPCRRECGLPRRFAPRNDMLKTATRLCQRREKNNVKRREEIDANAGIKNAGIPTAGCKPPVNCLPESRPGAR